MLVPNQIVKMKWHSRNKFYYVNRGYIFTAMGEEFDVKVEDLPLNSHVYVKVECDFCHNIINVKYQNYNNRGIKSDGYACTNCKHIKIHNVFNEVYGVDNPSQIDGFYEKSKSTCLDKYGVESYSSTQECKDKISKTCLTKYGCTNYISSEDGKKRITEANMKKFGVPYPFGNKEITEKLMRTQMEKYGGLGMGSKEIRQKIEETNIIKYGHKCVLSAPCVREKIINSFYNNQSGPCSKPQRELNDILKDIYGNSELNYPCRELLLDSMIIVDGEKIDVEYDCWYWHKNRGKEDFQRDWVVKQYGYKVLRVKAYTKLPTKEQIKEAVDYLVRGNHSFAQIIVEPKEKI